MMTKYCTFTAGDESFSHENNLNKTYIYECSGDPMKLCLQGDKGIFETIAVKNFSEF